jgi:hypothetical protein
MKNVKVDGVEVLGLTVKLWDGRHDDEDYDFGALTLSCDGREFILDVCQTYWDFSSGDSEISCDLEVDKDVFEDCEYDLTKEDLYSNELTAEFYLGGTFSNHVESITLFIKSGGCTKAIDVVQE